MFYSSLPLCFLHFLVVPVLKCFNFFILWTSLVLPPSLTLELTLYSAKQSYVLQLTSRTEAFQSHLSFSLPLQSLWWRKEQCNMSCLTHGSWLWFTTAALGGTISYRPFWFSVILCFKQSCSWDQVTVQRLIYLKELQKQEERDILHPFVHSVKGHNGQAWAIRKPEVRHFTCVFHIGAEGRAHVPIYTVLGHCFWGLDKPLLYTTGSHSK